MRDRATERCIHQVVQVPINLRNKEFPCSDRQRLIKKHVPDAHITELTRLHTWGVSLNILSLDYKYSRQGRDALIGMWLLDSTLQVSLPLPPCL